MGIQIAMMILVGLIFLLGLFLVFLFFGSPLEWFGGSLASKRAQMRKIVDIQRNMAPSAREETDKSNRNNLIEQSSRPKITTSKLTLEKSLRYARWRLPPAAYRALAALISIIVGFIFHQYFSLILVIASMTSGPIFMAALLNFFVQRRFKAFDKDYPAFLLNVVSMLKTGMNTIGAIQSAVNGLDDHSLVKEEVSLMIERLRLGVTEEKSIGSFGEDIAHPEIELFVQALLLSRKVGGSLSDTLDRLAKQVRKRQHFRESANAAVSLQRGSIWVIIGIMVALEVFIYFNNPELITSSFKNEVGKMVWEGAIVLILIGQYWIRMVTKIKI